MSYQSKNSMKSAQSHKSGKSGRSGRSGASGRTQDSHLDRQLKNNMAYQRFKKKDKAKGLADNEAINESKDILNKFK